MLSKVIVNLASVTLVRNKYIWYSPLQVLNMIYYGFKMNRKAILFQKLIYQK